MKLVDLSITEFAKVLGSDAPAPGGGSAAALSAANGISLTKMVCELTIGKKKYAEVEEEMQKYLTDLKNMQQEFLHFSDRDAEVFAPLAECYRLPSATLEEKEHKDAVMEEKLLDASMVPVEIMEKSLELLEILDVLADKGSRMAVSDVGVAVQFTRTALLGAVMNVYINTKSIKNREKAEEINQKAKRMIKIGTSQADEIYEKVLAQLI